MKKIDLKKEIMDLEDKPIVMSSTDSTPITVGKVVALIVQNYKGKKFDPIKLLELARNFYKKEMVLLDKSDLNGVKDIVRDDATFGPLIRGQVLETLEEAPDDGETK